MGSTKKKILCVEDDKDFCELLTLALPEFDFVNAATVLEAVEKAREGNFSLIFMESLLPDGSGEEACRQIRVFDRTTPILFITESRFVSETFSRSIGAQGSLRKGSPTFIDDLQNRALQLSAA